MTVILLSVSVPVLSEHIISQQPSVSTEGRFFTIALRRDIFCTPMASTIVTTAGRPSGIAATAIATAVMNASMNTWASMPVDMCAQIFTMNIIMAMPSTRKESIFAVLPSCLLRGEGSSCTSVSIWAILPISVFMPVAVTMPRPRP